MKLFDRLMLRLSGSPRGQRWFEQVSDRAQFWMGIGAGGSVETSGENAVIRLLQNRAAPPYVIFDIGANEGQYLKMLQQALVGKAFGVHCFEPGPAAYAVLSSITLSGGQAFFNRLALGSQPGEATLHYDRPGSGLASLTKRRLDHFGIAFEGQERVEVQTLDQYCAAYEIERIDLLKLDVEGHELDVLKGGADLFQQGRVGLVAFEFGGTHIDTHCFVQDFYYFFKEYRFTLLRVTPAGYLHPLDGYRESYEQFRTTNFVALKQG